MILLVTDFFKYIPTVFFIIFLSTSSSFAWSTTEKSLLRTNRDKDATLSIVLENDYVAGQDNGYTNGFRLSWLSPEHDVPGLLLNLASYMPLFESKGRKRYGVTVGQVMFSPDNLNVRTLIKDDRPYAGYLYGSVGLLSDTGYRLDHLQLTAGIIGPSSLAEKTQKFVHDVGGFTNPLGWDNQLKDEFGVILTYERKWRGIYEFSQFGLAVDLTPHIGASLGNVHTNVNMGLTARIGYDLPSDYGVPLIRPSLPGSDFFSPTKGIGWYVFIGAEGRAVAHNIFLDGNTFKDSHSVDKKIFVGGLQAGLAVTLGSARLSYTHIIRTDEFDGQDTTEEFGALNLSIKI